MRVFQASKAPVRAIAFSTDGRYLAAGGVSVSVRVWDTLTDAKPVVLSKTTAAAAISFRPDGLAVACGSQMTRLWSWPGRQPLGVAPHPVMNLSGVAFTHDGRVVVGTQDRIECWDLSGTVQWRFSHAGTLNRLVCGPGDRLVILSDSSRLTRVNALSGERLAVAELPTSVSLRSLAFSPDAQRLAVAADARLLLWDVATWGECARLAAATACNRLAYRPDGSSILGAAHDALRLWTADLSCELRAFDFRIGEITALSFAPDGMRAVAGTWDGRVVMWDLD